MTSSGDADGPKSTPANLTISTSTRLLKDFDLGGSCTNKKRCQKDVANLPNSYYINAIIEKLSTKLEERLEGEDRKINALEARVNVLESKFAVLGALDSRIEENEQCSRRFCLRFHGIPLPRDGNEEACVFFQSLYCHSLV